MSGREIMDEVSRRHRRPQEFARERMTLVSRGATEAVRTMRRYLRRDEAGTYRYLVVFDMPPGIRGTAVLTWEAKNRPDDQFLYLPALDRVTRIIGGAKRKSFMGTDFTFEDLSVEDEDEYGYERLPDQTIEGKPHYVVRATAEGADIRDTTGYGSRQIFVQVDNFLINRVAYFTRAGGPMKTLSILQAKQMDGQTWRATEYVMTNHLEDHSTRVESLESTFDQTKVPPTLFEQRYLTTRAHMR
jgi:hypothetical protein